MQKLLDDDFPELPLWYSVFRRLKLHDAPYLEAGGLLDQPYLANLALEACIHSENRFKAKLNGPVRPQTDS